MKSIKIIIILSLLVACRSSVDQNSISSTEEKQPNYAFLRKELEEVYDIDQNIRNIDWDTISSTEASIAYSMKMMVVDSVNQTRVITIIE